MAKSHTRQTKDGKQVRVKESKRKSIGRKIAAKALGGLVVAGALGGGVKLHGKVKSGLAKRNAPIPGKMYQEGPVMLGQFKGDKKPTLMDAPSFIESSKLALSRAKYKKKGGKYD
jgi:hypothetical protein